jgi:hypothetical protein
MSLNEARRRLENPNHPGSSSLPSPRKLEDTTRVTGCPPGKISDVVIVGSGAYCSKHNQAKNGGLRLRQLILPETFRRFENSRNVEVSFELLNLKL